MLLSNGTASDPRLDIYADDNVTRDAAVTAPVHGAKTPATLAPGLAIVILTLDRADLMLPLLATLDAARTRLNDHCPVDIIVGDTGSTAPELLAEYDRLADQVIVERNMRYHFSRCNNQLFNRHVRRELVLFLNNDVIFPDAADALEMMIAEMRAKPELGGLGTVLHYPDMTCQHAGVDMLDEGPLRGLCHHPGHGAAPPRRAHGESWPTMAVTGACLLTRSALFADVGGFDEAYRTECQDIALCLAMRRRGFEMAVINAGRIIHLENATRPAGSEDWQDRQRFVRKWTSFMDMVR